MSASNTKTPINLSLLDRTTLLIQSSDLAMFFLSFVITDCSVFTAILKTHSLLKSVREYVTRYTIMSSNFCILFNGMSGRSNTRRMLIGVS